MVINIHAGHNPDGKPACGAVGIIKESTEARKVKDEVMLLLRQEGHTVYDCTVDDGISQGNVLSRITAKCNEHQADLDISIHFNAGAGDRRGDGRTAGTEVLVYSESSRACKYAERVGKKIAELGYRNRGVKYRADLYILNKTKNPAMLIECCFVDDKDDILLYDYRTMAGAIADGILGSDTISQADCIFKVQCGAFSDKKNADAYAARLKASGFSAVVVKQP